MKPGVVALPFVVLLSACPPAPAPTPESTPVRLTVDLDGPLRVAMGETATFTVHVKSPQGGAPPKYAFWPGSTDPDFPFAWSVSKTGAGTETVTVTGQNYGNPYRFLQLHVCPDEPSPTESECDGLDLPVTVYGGAPAQVTLPASTASMVVGERRRLDGFVLSVPRATPNYPSAAARSSVALAWTSSQPSVVQVSADGAIEAKGVGSATLTATAGSVSRSLDVTVTAGTLGPPPDGTQALFAGAQLLTPKVGAFDDRGFAFAAGDARAPGTDFFYPFLAEWTGSAWGISLITPPSHPGTVEALFLEHGRVYVLVRTAYGLALLDRSASDPHAAWATLPFERLSGLHAELDPSVLKDRIALMYLEGEAPFTGLDSLEQDGGLFIVAGSYETNTKAPWPFQCIENVRLFEVKNGAITHRDVMSQSHHIGLGNQMPTQNDACAGPIAPGGSLGLLPRLPGEPFPRVIYGAAPDAVLSSTTPTLIPTLDGERYGGPEGAHEFIPRTTGRWAHRPLIPDGGIDVGQGRSADRLIAAGVPHGTPDDPQGVFVDVPDPFLGGTATITRFMMRTPDGGWAPTPAEPPEDYLDPLMSFGHVPYDAPPSRWGRAVSYDHDSFLVGSFAKRQPLFTEPVDRTAGQRLGDTTKTDALLAEPLFTASGNTVLVTRRLNATAIYAAGPAEVRFKRSTRDATFFPRFSFTVGESLFFYDGPQLARSDDLGVTTQVVRTFSDTIQPKQVAVHPSGAAFIQDVASGVFERRFSPNLATAPIAQVPPPSAALLAGTLDVSFCDETETAARVLGDEFIVLTRIGILRSGSIVKKLLVEHFDLTGARTSETLLDYGFPNPNQQLMFPGGVLLSATSFAALGYVPGESQVVVFDLQTGATRSTSFPLQRVGTVFNQFTAYDRLLRTASGKLLVAQQDPDLGLGYRVSTDDGLTFGALQRLPPLGVPTLTAWSLHPTTGQLVTVLSTAYGPAYPNVASVRVYPAP